MKATILITALLTAMTATASPTTPNVKGKDLLARTTCKVVVKLGFDKHGTCVDTTKGNACASGLLVPGHCPGANNIICCIPNDCFTPG